MKFSNKDIELFNEAGICIEDKNYTTEEVENLKMKKVSGNMYQKNGCKSCYYHV